MIPVQHLLGRVRGGMLRQNALVWATRSLALAGLAAALELALTRIWPLERNWPALAGCVAAAAAIGVAGWIRDRPTWAEAARQADHSLASGNRLITALEFATAGGYLAARQRQDTVLFAAGADPGRVTPLRPPRRWTALAAAAVLAAAVLAWAPNPALQRLRSGEARSAAQQLAATRVEQLARQAERGGAGVDPARQAQLVETLRRAESKVAQARRPADAVAALSQAQEALTSLQDPAQASKQQAAAAAGDALAKNPQAAAASRALAGQDQKAAATELGRLAGAVGSMSEAQRQALAGALAQAASAAQADPRLAGDLQKASEALAAGDPARAEAALNAAAQDAAQNAADEQFNGDLAQASNGLQAAKADLGQAPARGEGGPGSAAAAAPGGRAAGQAPGSQAGSGQAAPGQPGSGQGGSGGAGGGGGQGGPGSKPAAGSEKVYVPSQAAGTDPNAVNTDPSGTGSEAQLVPYQQVLAEYRASALSQVDRQLIPESERSLVQSYFSDLGR